MLSTSSFDSSHQGANKFYFEPSQALFLGDLSYFCTEDDLCALFGSYGPISTVKVQRGITGEPLLHGYIAFASPVCARKALLDLDGHPFMGRTLRYLDSLCLNLKTLPLAIVSRVQMGTTNHHRREKLGASDMKNYTQLHVSFISKRVSIFIYSLDFSV